MDTITLTTLNLAKDIELPEELTLHGTLTSASNEVIVIQHYARKIYKDAYVCHITKGPYGPGIYDMPKFQHIALRRPLRKIDNINYTMICIADTFFYPNQVIPGTSFNNWLW